MPGSPSPRGADAVAARVTATSELLSRLWRQNLPLLRDRVDCLQRAADDAAGPGLSVAGQTAAADLAHKLAGSLGMFGYPRGTEIAREMEQLLDHGPLQDSTRLRVLASELRDALPLED
jgi:HPt (histidine-containing phosphotransfer) domain-containing protein